MIDLTVITPTAGRHSQLGVCLELFRMQEAPGVRREHLVVSDGIDPHARWLAKAQGARYIERASRGGQWGSLARDAGIAAARGEFVCFWDDDNWYDPLALAVLHTAVQGVDIAVVQTRYRYRTRPGAVTIPRSWTGQFIAGDVDTMCVCVRRELALLEPWEQVGPEIPISTDHHWLSRVQRHTDRIRFVPIVIGWHL